MSESGSQASEGCTQPGSPPEKSPLLLPARVVLSDAEAQSLTSQEWAARWKLQDAYVTTVDRRLLHQEGELAELRQTTDRMRQQLTDAQQRERLLMRRLTAKEQEMQDYVCQLTELKAAQVPSTSSLRSSLLDPAVNVLIEELKSQLHVTKSKLEDTQNELTAWKFTPDSNTGKRLMAKCRLLYQENEELGKISSSGRIAKLESDLALQKSFAEEVRQSQNELDSFLADLDEDVEGMQSTILFLQQELRKAKEANQQLQKDNAALKATVTATAAATSPVINLSLNNAAMNNNNTSSMVVVTQQQQQQQTLGGGGNGNGNNSSALLAAANGTRSNGDSSSGGSSSSSGGSRSRVQCANSSQERTDFSSSGGESDSGGVGNSGPATRTRVKRVRTSSVLSIDYNEDDALVISTTNGDVVMTSDPE